ncbi:hypothetical protein ACFLRR_00610 [Bacteroidota bacterium]
MKLFKLPVLNHWSYLADLVVIVLGIIIALSLDAWWQEKQDRKLERKYLISLKVDLKADLFRISDLNDKTIRRIGHSTRILKHLNAKIEHPTVFNIDSIYLMKSDSISQRGNLVEAISTIGKVWKLERFAPTYDELTNTGFLRLLTNDSLRLELRQYYLRIESSIFLEEEQSYVLWRDYHKLMQTHGINIWDWTGDEDELVIMLAKIPGLEQQIRRVRNTFYLQAAFIRQIPKRINKLITMFDDELSRNY